MIPCNPVKSEAEAFKAAVRKLGPEVTARLPSGSAPASPQASRALPDAGGPSAAHPPASQPTDLTSQVYFAPLLQPLVTCSQACEAALQCEPQLSSLQSVIGTYLESKHKSALTAHAVCCYSTKQTRIYNHVMHKLETLSAQVLTSKPSLKPLWMQAINPFRRQLFGTLYASNRYVQAFAGGLPNGRLGLPSMDDWSLGHPNNTIPTFAPLNPNRPLLSQVHTALLANDGAAMNQPSSVNRADAGSCWHQADMLMHELVPIVTHYDPQGVDLHFLNHRNLRQGLQTSQDVQAVFSRIRPTGGAPVGKYVQAILDGYLSTLRYERNLKPLNLVVTTAGEEDNWCILMSAITDHLNQVTKRGYPGHQLGIEFLLVGSCNWVIPRAISSEHHLRHRENVVLSNVVGSTHAQADTLAQIICSGTDARIHSNLRKRGIIF